MLAFEISINGQPLRTVGIGDFGMLSAGLEWARIAQDHGGIYQHLWVVSNAMNSTDKTHHQWQNVALKVGDEVTFKIVSVESADPPPAGDPDYPPMIND